jgi:hypothetical protein
MHGFTYRNVNTDLRIGPDNDPFHGIKEKKLYFVKRRVRVEKVNEEVK